jgi:hypothetical protein
VFDDHTDTWNCPTCRQPIAEVYDSPTLGELHPAVAGHRCTPSGSTGTPHPHDTDEQGDDR